MLAMGIKGNSLHVFFDHKNQPRSKEGQVGIAQIVRSHYFLFSFPGQEFSHTMLAHSGNDHAPIVAHIPNLS